MSICSLDSLVSNVISLILRDSDRGSENVSLIWLSEPDGQKKIAIQRVDRL